VRGQGRIRTHKVPTARAAIASTVGEGVRAAHDDELGELAGQQGAARERGVGISCRVEQGRELQFT